MSATKHLIVNADDFGQSPGVNRGIIEAHEHGIVTSASLMTRWEAAAEAAQYAIDHPKLSVGLHLDLGEWAYRAGSWVPLYSVVPLDDDQAVLKEITGQLATFRRLVGRDPSHIDSHQHVHLRQPGRSAVLHIARSLHIPVRDCSSPAQYCGKFYGQTAEGAPLPDFISIEALLKILEDLPEGVTEIGCHPAASDDLNTMYRSERLEELRVLCDHQIKARIDALGVELCSFASLSAEWRASELPANKNPLTL
jgi:chitin disaccharide deacetylase